MRYPRGEGTGVPLPARGDVLPIGKGRIVREGSAIAILSLGTRLQEGLKAADELAALGPLDHGRRCAFRQADRHATGRAARARA